MIALAAEEDDSYWKSTGTIWLGFGLARQGQADVGIGMIRQVIKFFWQRPGMSSYLTLLAVAEGQAGRIDAALEHLAEARHVLEHTGERHSEAELYRLQGELLLKRAAPDHAQVESCFQRDRDNTMG